MNTTDGIDVLPAEPHFIVVEAKREQTFDSDKSKAQLLAQVRALSIRYTPSSVSFFSLVFDWQKR